MWKQVGLFKPPAPLVQNGDFSYSPQASNGLVMLGARGSTAIIGLDVSDL